MKNKWLKGALAITLVSMLCACGNDTQTGGDHPQDITGIVSDGGQQSEGTDSSGEAETTGKPEQSKDESSDNAGQSQGESAEQENPPEEQGEKSIADLYEATSSENIYKITQIATEGYGIEQAYLKDGYALLIMQEISEEGYMNEIGLQYLLDNGKIVLLPIDRPEDAVSLEVERFDARYMLLADGNVLVAKFDGSYTMYNSKLEVVCQEEASGSSFLGASEDGDVWFFDREAAEFALHREGKLVQIIPAEGINFGNFEGKSGEIAYFSMYDEMYDRAFYSIDLKDYTFEERSILPADYDIRHNRIWYSATDQWYLADIASPLMITTFTKPYSEERALAMDDRFLIGENIIYDEQTGTYYQDYHVYDMQNGGLCDKKSSTELAECYVNMYDYDQGIILFSDFNEKHETKGLYLWDISGSTAQEAASDYDIVDYFIDEERLEAMTQEIYDRYGVEVYYDQEHLNEFSSSYELSVSTNLVQIGCTLIMLKEHMAEYPEGFFEELKADKFQRVVYCLCDRYYRTDMYSIENPAATAGEEGDELRMTIDVHNWQTLRGTFLHENTHLMESRFEKFCYETFEKDFNPYWYTELNSLECPSMQSYIWDHTEENLKGVFNANDLENSWYIDAYSKSTMNEDKARIVENGINPASALYYESPHIDRKSRFMNALIREAFPCVKNSQEPVFWEERTGIVDLYQEFSDFTGQD